MKNLNKWPRSKTRDYILYPNLINLIFPIKGKKIIDIGCAEGSLIEKILKYKPSHCLGIDASKEMILSAEKNKKKLSPDTQNILEYRVGCCSKLNVKNNSFDIAILSHVLCMLKSIKLIEKSLSEVYRILKTNGIAIITIPHPAFDHDFKSPLIELHFDKPYYYFNSGLKCNSIFHSPQEKIEIVDYHYTIQDYIKAILNNKFKIIGIIEPIPNQISKKLDNKWYLDNSKTPTMIMFKIKK
jgi:ubiquinone/menaquinone biosynthesis C-methylase UbiE